MSAHDDHLDPDKHLWPVELPEWWTDMEDNCKAILKNYGAQHWGEVYRQVYKYTDCGATLGLLCSGQDKPAYNSELARYLADAPVIQLHVSSIVEGCDAETPTVLVDMTKPKALERLRAALTLTEESARALWDEQRMHLHSSLKHKRKDRK